MSQESTSAEQAGTADSPSGPRTAPTPVDPAAPADGSAADPFEDYDAAPPMRSAYPGAAEGGFQIEPVRQPEPGAAPGPGYGGPDARSQEAPEPQDGMWLLLPVLLAVILGLGTAVALSQWAAVTTVVVGVVALAAAVLSWPATSTMRRSVLIAAAGPAGVLIGYWVISMFQG